MIFAKKKYEEYTKSEFLDFLRCFFEFPDGMRGEALNDYTDQLIDHFNEITEHPDRSDVIFYPKKDQEDSPEGILKEVKEWRARHNKPGFKPE
ncbi:bacteriocin immunity protein [Pseudomonas hefeiensis]|uniref:Bacteriocin immunity protein n=1 Tax=Pseudomonas hefeiensis TaxID=2738125 RepID=A0ABY9GI29_9PSED|nr:MULTISPECIES: bacteriocin immunity protein [unclassified Pseudomonas]WLH15151.1 bacteriocin immunity protein [Pseudomonas sp. FP205]WLH98197.1 bacteriocin immunity protein [Pseudomonas sp. FP53]WLI42473.1 bacteriocin immunity protein [Pseudomonas sp. FP821]